MMLWTWQGVDFNPLGDRIDRSKSDYFTNPPFPELPSAYAKLDKLLALPAGSEHQYVWCYTTDSWLLHPWSRRCVWPIEIPKSRILAYIDEPSWERLIGSRSIPLDTLEQWRRDLWRQKIYGELHDQGMSQKQMEYHINSPSPESCWQSLLTPTGPGDNVLALASLPFHKSWIRPYDCSKRYGFGSTRKT